MDSMESRAAEGEAAAANRADVELARQARRGDPEAVKRLVARLACVRRFLVYRNRRFGNALSPDELEDVIQETLFAVWRKLDDYRGHGSLEAWSYRFSYLELLTRMRKLERRPQLLDDVEGGVLEPRASLGPDALEFEHLYRALDKLSHPGAEVIRLKFLEHLTFDEISARLAIPTNTAKTRFYRGLTKLRAELSKGRSPREENEAPAESLEDVL